MNEIIDYDEQIKLAKEALTRDIAHTKKVYNEVIADLEGHRFKAV